jgi:cytochrome c biogenesis protein ResB
VRRLYRLLRSRKLAFWLIGAFVAYSAVATSVTEGDFERAYANPVFYAITTALALATAACAWERTGGAARAWRAGTATSAEFVERLSRTPQIAVPLRSGTDARSVLDDVGRRMRAMRLRVRVGDGRLAATTPRLALLGSPAFHWALVALFVIVAAGRMTRAEGLMGVPVGSERIDAAESYGTLDEGALHDSDFTGLTIRVTDIRRNHVVGGVDRGTAPLVELWRDGKRVAGHLVYPNSPLRYGSLLIHSNAYGLNARFTLVGAAEEQSTDVFYDFSEESLVAEAFSPLVVAIGEGSVTVETGIPLDLEGDIAPWVIPSDPRVEWRLAGNGVETTGSVGPGESIDLGGGAALRLEDVTYYARLSVVDDWSVYPLYAVLIIAVIGLALALLLPPKTVWVMLVESDGVVSLNARTRQSRADRVFAASVESTLRAAAEGRDERP